MKFFSIDAINVFNLKQYSYYKELYWFFCVSKFRGKIIVKITNTYFFIFLSLSPHKIVRLTLFCAVNLFTEQKPSGRLFRAGFIRTKTELCVFYNISSKLIFLSFSSIFSIFSKSFGVTGFVDNNFLDKSFE